MPSFKVPVTNECPLTGGLQNSVAFSSSLEMNTTCTSPLLPGRWRGGICSHYAQVCREPKPEEENETWYQNQVVNLKRMDEKIGAYIQAKGYAL
jgi:hypothetical protein